MYIRRDAKFICNLHAYILFNMHKFIMNTYTNIHTLIYIH